MCQIGVKRKSLQAIVAAVEVFWGLLPVPWANYLDSLYVGNGTDGTERLRDREGRDVWTEVGHKGKPIRVQYLAGVNATEHVVSP